MNKRDLVLSLMDPAAAPERIPAAFFLHFDEAHHFGQAAVEKHLEFFHATDMDFVKIQYERTFPKIPEIQRAKDWAKMPFYGLDFYAPQLAAVEGLVKAAKRDALVIQTLYSPFMCAGHTTSDELVTAHIMEDPQAVNRGMRVITDSLMGFVRECIRLGVDGFYMSTQGGEAARFTAPFGGGSLRFPTPEGGGSLRFPTRKFFDLSVRPFDLELMKEADANCIFNILHVCDYRLPYDDYAPYVEYPGQIVNASLELTGGRITPQEVEALFGRSFMGGLDRLGILATGIPDQARDAAKAMLQNAPGCFLLAADCTVPATTPWENLRAAVDTAHGFRPHGQG